ncbi:MAG TPA: cation:proton antiporter [Candidatus Kapabacteria bacterium]|nr:cation:proton antiporter [Candidatus Kapabacteria bacterium]HOV92576.1 cation:proton antiporter [Candidatus Kapabacteria bacterium]
MESSQPNIVILLLSISIMLFAAKVFGEIFIKLKQPAIIGEILAGIILGPTVLGTISPDIFYFLFPPQGATNNALTGLTNLSVVLLLLISGMEVDLNVVLKNSSKALVISCFGIIIPFAIGFLMAWFYPFTLGIADVNNKLIFALFIGTALSISALPVIAKTLMDLNIYKMDIGMMIIASAMINDLIGWLVFSVILGMMGNSSSHFNFLEILLFIILFFIILFVFLRRIIDKIVNHIQEKWSFPGSILIFIMVLGIAGAAYTQYIGIHAVLGAFLVGIAIGEAPSLSERVREILNQFVSNIFAPLFFVSIGLGVNFIQNFNLGLVLIILLISIIGKVAGSYFGARISGVDSTDSAIIGLGLNSRGTMEIILGLLALQVGIITNQVFVALVIMALVTSLISAPLMNILLSRRKLSDINSLINKKYIKISDAKTKEEVIDELCGIISNSHKLDKNEIKTAILEREITLPTGIANYLALPHCRYNKLQKPALAIAVNKNGVDFNTADNTPAKFIFLLITPENKNELQLQLLANIVRKFQNRDAIESILKLNDINKIEAELRKL